MADLDLIRKLNSQYGKASPIRRETKLFALNESLDIDRIEKGLSDSLTDMGPSFTRCFDFGLSENVVLLFVDVCDFSTRLGDLNGEDIGDFFDEYYDLVIPILYKYGGEVDKILGDGIICVFGPPFQCLSLDKNIEKANKCAKEIIKATEGTIFSSKIAMHSGEINYFKNKTGLYKEFTLIGKPLTELFRLESISLNEQISYYDGTAIREYYKSLISNSRSRITSDAQWLHSNYLIKNLKGVSFKSLFSIEHNS
jgi:class 3 adenylate cyclase